MFFSVLLLSEANLHLSCVKFFNFFLLSLRTHTHSRMLSEKSFLTRTECHYMRRTHASDLRECKKNSFPVWLFMFSLRRGASVFHQHQRAPSSTGKTRSRETRILCGDFFSFFVHTIKHSNRQTRISRKKCFFVSLCDGFLRVFSLNHT